jgi:DNA repair exonuclease SbcCD ATPase subunit
MRLKFATVICTIIIALAYWTTDAQQGLAQRVPLASSPDKCREFDELLKGMTAGQSNPEQIEKKYGQLVDAAKTGQECAKVLAEAFRKLKGQDGSVPSWNRFEETLDKIIDQQRSLIEQIEGAGGLIEQATLGEVVLEDRIKQAAQYGEEAVAREKDRLTKLQNVIAITRKQKDQLAQMIREMQAAKPAIAWQESGKQWDDMIHLLDRFNTGLEALTKQLPQVPPGTPGM